MLIRIVDHFRNNPKRIDKLISIKGLPEDWIFSRTSDGQLELKRPWIPDIDLNIPHEIRSICEPTYVIFKYPPIEKGAAPVIEYKKILGIKIDYNTEPGRELWDKIERYVEESIPRDERVPEPVICSKDERSPFETFLPRRSAQNRSLQLEPHSVPDVDLTRYQVKKTPEPVIPTAPIPETEKMEETVTPATSFRCEECGKEYIYEKIFKKHVRNHKKEKVVA